MARRWIDRSGFTLVEILVVVAILGVVAGIVIPRFATSTEDAKLAALDADLARLRKATEIYHLQHGGSYPGAREYTDGLPVLDASNSKNAFTRQLTQFSDAAGVTNATKTANFRYGPYLKSVPKNPFNGLDTVVCDITESDLTVATSSGASGWKFYVQTGRLIANDGSHDAN